MTSTRDRWMRFLFVVLCSAAAQSGLAAAHAQGFGPDPFRPFNSMYDQYVYPIRPETGAAAMPRVPASRGDNQFQQYMNELEGVSRLSSGRFGPGVPYWKLRSDVKQDERDRLNRRNGRKNVDVLGSVTQQYIAYFSEESPRKRAILLREYNPSRHAEDRDGEGRQGDSAEDDEREPAPDGSRRTRREADRASGAGARSGATSGLRRSAEKSEEKSGRSIPPPPPLRGIARDPSRTNRRPTDVLERSRRLKDQQPDSGESPARKNRNRDQTKPSSPDE